MVVAFLLIGVCALSTYLSMVSDTHGVHLYWHTYTMIFSTMVVNLFLLALHCCMSGPGSISDLLIEMVFLIGMLMIPIHIGMRITRVI